VFVEALTYRFVGHSRSDPGAYRKPGELDEWKARDPLIVARARLSERYGMSGETVDRVDEEVEEQIAATVQAATDAPFPQAGEPAREFAP
jgi:TPP-dependent pyruvate/acetoin dehydrogenase alpha subunit